MVRWARTRSVFFRLWTGAGIGAFTTKPQRLPRLRRSAAAWAQSINVLGRLFQKAVVSKGNAFGRRSQTAECLIVQTDQEGGGARISTRRAGEPYEGVPPFLSDLQKNEDDECLKHQLLILMDF